MSWRAEGKTPPHQGPAGLGAECWLPQLTTQAQKTGDTAVRVTIRTNSWHQTTRKGMGIQDVVAEPNRWAEHRSRKCRAERAEKSGSLPEVGLGPKRPASLDLPPSCSEDG